MKLETDRREFLKLAGLGGGVVFASTLWGRASSGADDEFHFVQLSDTHWGFEGPPNPDAKDAPEGRRGRQRPLPPARLRRLHGDLTHDRRPRKRRDRMKQFRDVAGKLRAKTVRFLPGEHDASLDRATRTRRTSDDALSFDHKGVHFVVLDNVSDPGSILGRRSSSGSRTTAKRKDSPSPSSRTARPSTSTPNGTGRRRTEPRRSRSWSLSST